MAARCGRCPFAACGVRPAHQAQIHNAGECAAADLRAVLLAAQGAPRLLFPLSRELLARQLRYAWRADQDQLAQRRKSLRARIGMSEEGVTEIYFYHLERRTLEEVLPTLLEMSLKRGWRAAVQAASEERVEALDTLLWTYREESFLPHGTKRDGNPAQQPVYLTMLEENPNGATVRFLVDGAEIPDLTAYARIVYMFEGRDAAAVARAREQWKGAKAAG